MIRKAFHIVLIFILISLGSVCTVMGYDDEEVICNLDSLINGTFYQGADIYETALGDFTADAVRFSEGTDVAFVNAGDLNAVLDAGSVTWSDVKNVFTENRKLAVAQMTAEDIWDQLEYSVSFITVGDDLLTDREKSSFEGFLQVSGIKYEFDAASPAGSRLKYLIIGDTQVNRHDNLTTVSVCASEKMLEGGYGFAPFAYEKSGITLTDALRDYLKNGEYQATTLVSGRASVKGTRDRPVVSRGMWIVIGGILCVAGFLFNRFKKKIAPDRSFYSHIDPDRSNTEHVKNF